MLPCVVIIFLSVEIIIPRVIVRAHFGNVIILCVDLIVPCVDLIVPWVDLIVPWVDLIVPCGFCHSVLLRDHATMC